MNQFSQPAVLKAIGHRGLALLLSRFDDDFFHTNIQFPDPETDAAGYLNAVATFFASPESLPERLRATLLALECSAAPENRDALEATILQYIPNIAIPHDALPVDRALELWFHCPNALLALLPADFQTIPQPAGSPTNPSIHQSTNPLAISHLEPRDFDPRNSDLGSINPSIHESSNPLPPQSTNPPAATLHLRLAVLFHEIEPVLFHDFVRFFQNDLLALHPKLPQPSSPTDPKFADAAFSLITSPGRLPPRMHAALLAMQELAAPRNRTLLDGLLAQAGIPAPPSTPPDQLALQYWLRCPFPIERLEHLRAQLAANPPPPPPEPGDPTLHYSLSTMHSSVPGDLAALARFPRYKISHLPPEVREALNQMLRRRVPYAQIIRDLGEPAKHLNKSNLSLWKKTGYLLWLAEQQRREDAETQLQLLFDTVREKDNGKIHEATQQIAALRISQILAGFDPATLIQSLQQHPQTFVRLVQTLPSLSRGGMDCERLLLELADRKASQNGEEQKPRCISEKTMKYITQKLNLM